MWQYTGIPAISPHSGSRYPPLYAISVSNARTKCQTRSSHKFIPSWECLSLPQISIFSQEFRPFQKYPAPFRNTSFLPGIPVSPLNIHLLPGVPSLFKNIRLLPEAPLFSQEFPISLKNPHPFPEASSSRENFLHLPEIPILPRKTPSQKSPAFHGNFLFPTSYKAALGMSRDSFIQRRPVLFIYKSYFS